MPFLPWTLNLGGGDAPPPPGSGCYGPFLLYGLNLNPGGGEPPASAVGGRDWDVLDAARALLLATSEFDGVHRAALPEDRGRPSGDRIAAVLSLASGDEIDASDDPDAVSYLHSCRYVLTLVVREDDPDLRERTLDRLLNVAQDALDGRSIGGVTMPGYTKLRSWTYQRPSAPEQRLAVVGEFKYLIDGPTGHDTSE